MGQTPHYLQDTENPAAIEALLTYLARLLNRTLDMSQFPKAVREFRAEGDRAVAKSREAAGQSGLLVDELVVEREEMAFNTGSTMVSIVMRAADSRACQTRSPVASLRRRRAGDSARFYFVRRVCAVPQSRSVRSTGPSACPLSVSAYCARGGCSP